MDPTKHPHGENIRKIEDIIDLQKINGNFVRQLVSFNLPVETGSTVSTNLVKSLESGLSTTKTEKVKKNGKKSRLSRERNLPDAVSWPSDSDITVLRMKLCLGKDLKKNVGSFIPGDGLHQQDSSSMVNLATMMLQSSPPSKQSVNVQEYLLPLTSWEHGKEQDVEASEVLAEEKIWSQCSKSFNQEVSVYDARSNSDDQQDTGQFTLYDSDVCSKNDTKSKLAKFLRLYFCPCCTCLYKMERMKDEQFAYSSKCRQLKI